MKFSALLTAVCCLLIAPVASAQIATVSQIAFYSDELINLHHTLYAAAWAKRSATAGSAARPLSGPLPAPLDAPMTAEERATWDDAVAFYDKDVASIIGFSGMLADDGALDPEKRTLAQVARRNAEQLLWQVNNLLDQARITAGQMAIDPVPTSIADVMDHVMATLAGVPRRPRVELRCSGQARVPARLRIDGQRLQQILINLGANALKFTDAGVVHLTVDWEAGWLTTSIEDTGHGIPAEALDRIFEPFAQSPTRTRQNGTGLGLTISRNLARLMGGELTVTSTVGVGSTFRLRMPAPVVPVDRPAADIEPIVAMTPRAGIGPAMRAVVADDSEDIRTFLTVSLRRMGLEVSPVESGEAAVSLALADQPDLVLLDVQMPVMGGPEAAHALRRAGFSRLVIGLIAGSGDALESGLLAAGFDAVVFKPVTGPNLTSVITGLLAGQRDRPTPTPVAKAAGLT